MTSVDIGTTSDLARRVLDEVNLAVVGKRDALTLVLCGVLAGGHVLLEDLPGLGKTLAARSFAQALGLRFTRAQFTPDLLPADLTGSFVFDQRVHEFVFRRGPLFTGLLLADEINRTPPKTQAALLEAMQERQITVEGETFVLEAPFHVLATANPVEYEGTYPLPEAQLDRFLLRISFGYPTPAEEWQVLERRMQRRQEAQELRTIVDGCRPRSRRWWSMTTSAGIALIWWLPLGATRMCRLAPRRAVRWRCCCALAPMP
jgi:MoxR-like ATPase